MNKGIIAAIIVVVIVIAGGAYALTKKSDKNAPASSTGASSQTQATNPSTSGSGTNTSTSTDQNSAATITYGGSGFSPATLTVKAGTTVTIKNTSSNPLQFNSDPHPEHTDNTELNVGTVDENGSQTFTVTKTGTWGYHNHLNPSETGTIIVQ